MNNTDEASSQRITSQLDNLVDETSAASAELKRRIQTLARQKGSGREGQIKSQQVRPRIRVMPVEVTESVMSDEFGQVKVRGSYSKLPDR